MADLTLYTNPQSRGRIARWMLEEVGQPYDTVLLGYGGSMKAGEYLAINPMGKVPAIRHGEQVVTETAAICAYLADAFPEAGLAPDPAARGDYYRWMFFAAGPLEQATTNHYMKFAPEGDQRMMAGYGSYDQAVDAIERAVAGKRFIAGDRFSAADVYVGSHLMWGTGFGLLPKRQAFLDYIGGLAERPAHVRASQIDNAAQAEAQG